jgi:hypothetical protein
MHFRTSIYNREDLGSDRVAHMKTGPRISFRREASFSVLFHFPPARFVIIKTPRVFLSIELIIEKQNI